MLDFLTITARPVIKKNSGYLEIYPDFILMKSSDLMIRGGDFYAIWVEKRGLWSTDEQDALRLIDEELYSYAETNKQRLFDTYFNGNPVDVRILTVTKASTGLIDKWHKYCQRQMRDNYVSLDDTLIFANSPVRKEDYASKRLSYSLTQGECPAYDRLMSVLYSPEERHKLEWAIGSVVCGESKNIQKFIVLYGSHGTGKSTVLNIIEELFDGYYGVFDAKALGSSNNSFALEAFKDNPLVAIQHDGDLSKIEDNTRLNSVVSHEKMTVNEKFKSTYSNRFKCFLFMGTNKPVRITDAKSGLIRRLIDVTPTGNIVPVREYNRLTKQIIFELGPIAWHCREVYQKDPHYYDKYVPLAMFEESNDFFNYISEMYFEFRKRKYVPTKYAYEEYKKFCEEAKVQYPMTRRVFKAELKNYFKVYHKSIEIDGILTREVFEDFDTDRIDGKPKELIEVEEQNLIIFEEQPSILDQVFAYCPAQYATDEGTPINKWLKVETTLKDLDTTKLHYVKPTDEFKNYIFIDFDFQDADGNKDYEKNLEEASKWPPTYAELSKSGTAIHLHYIYDGDVNKLNSIYSKYIEVKVNKGNSAIRRKLSKCNNLPIATISSGLPLKEEKNVIDMKQVQSEQGLRNLILRNLRKDILPGTKPSIEFIKKNLDDAYNSGLVYDVSDMENTIINFAMHSTHHAQYCLEVVSEMKFKSENGIEAIEYGADGPLIFLDVEVFPNLFVICWKREGDGEKVYRMMNPDPDTVKELLKMKLVVFNGRRYDNHILMARTMGYTNEMLYEMSNRIVNKHDDRAFIGAAYNVSYTDIYDFASSGNKKSLKKLEIEMGIHHQELGLPWDQPVPERLWETVADYCCNDVIATEAAFHYLKGDWAARQILSDMAGLTVNDTTNTLTKAFIFGSNKSPQNQFHYRDLSKPVYQDYLSPEEWDALRKWFPEMMATPHGDAMSWLPYFPDYIFDRGKSKYRGIITGEGGLVQEKCGMYGNVGLSDISSQHPHSAITEMLFGLTYTTRYKEILDARIAVKHQDWDTASKMLDGKLIPWIERVQKGELKPKDIANALKTAINSVYGLTKAGFDNAFRDPRNVDNIVAKRGALFMTDLKMELEESGYIVAHIKTDSIKIPDATLDSNSIIFNFGKRYGYTFEHEAIYDRMCLVNKSTYIARYKDPELCKAEYGYIPSDNAEHPNEWTATGTQFAVPYVFKTLFSKEPLEFNDLCWTFSSREGALYLDFNERLPDVTAEEKELAKHLKDGDDPNSDRIQELNNKIAVGHHYTFIGNVGQFCPVVDGAGGGRLVWKTKDGRFNNVANTTGYRWIETESVTTQNLERRGVINLEYFNRLVEEAINDISMFGDFELFVSDIPYTKGLFDKTSNRNESQIRAMMKQLIWDELTRSFPEEREGVPF